MTKLCLSSSSIFVTGFVYIVIFFIPAAHALGSGSTLAIISGTATVCGVVAAKPTQRIKCYRRGRIIPIEPNVSFSRITGGEHFFCGLRSGDYSFFCWDTEHSRTQFYPKRIYLNKTVLLRDLAVGDDQVCGTMTDTAGGDETGIVRCWRGGDDGRNHTSGDKFASISSGHGFSCGILMGSRRVKCWGRRSIAGEIESEFGNMTMLSLVTGGAHACGLNSTGFLVCKGNNNGGQLNVPVMSPLEYSQVAPGISHTCAIRRSNGSVVCWGGGGNYTVNSVEELFFELIVSGSNFTCGLTSANFSVICWGPGWHNSNENLWLPLPEILPGPCVSSSSSCSSCGIYPDSNRLCHGLGVICKPCPLNISSSSSPYPESPPSSPPPPPPPSSSRLNTRVLALAIVGSIGIFSSLCFLIYCFLTGVCLGDKKIHNSVPPRITRTSSNERGAANNNGLSGTATMKRQGSRVMRRQRSGTSSKRADKAGEFTFMELAAATNNFSSENKIGGGSFGLVYKGRLQDGREVAIKRGEIGHKRKKLQEKESAFESEISFLSRLNHKHLVRLVGYCEDGEERLLVYDYMRNGALYDHLHNKNNSEATSSVINSWKTRIKIALDAARGIEYLHNYAVPPIIHRDIKSSNILLDGNWTARVSDFGLSLMGSEAESDRRPVTKAAGTVGYIDPEYYGLNVLTTKSDVYGLGVVLLELLTGKRAIFKNNNEGTPESIVDFAVPKITEHELPLVLDGRVSAPEKNEVEAVELVAYTAVHCVNLEGKERPTMIDIVASLEKALSFCHSSHSSISSGVISISSD